MRKATDKHIPTDDEIRQYQNVPVAVAARYLGISTATLYNALQAREVDFGFVSEKVSDAYYNGISCTYQISPERLIGYQRGTLPIIPIKVIKKIVHHAIIDAIPDGGEIYEPKK